MPCAVVNSETAHN